MKQIRIITQLEAIDYEVRGAHLLFTNHIPNMLAVFGLRDWWLTMLGKHFARVVKRKLARFDASCAEAVALKRAELTFHQN